MAVATANDSGYTLTATVNVGATSPSTNQSRLDYDLTLTANTPYSTGAGFTGFTPSPTLVYVSIAGVNTFYTLITTQRNVPNGSSLSYVSGSVWVTHTSAGTLSTTFFGNFRNINTRTEYSYLPNEMRTNTGSLTGTNYNRSPQAPAVPTVTRDTYGTQITVVSGVAADATGVMQPPPNASLQVTPPPAISDYQYQQSTTSSTTGFGTGTTMGLDRTSVLSLSAAQVYWYKTRGINSENSDPVNQTDFWSAATVSYAAPTISSVTSIGTTATVTLAAPANNGGSAINASTGYTIEYSTDSTFATGTTTVTGRPTGANTLTGLLPGRTYYFRARYINALSVNSPYTRTINNGATLASTFIAAYGRRWVEANISAATTGATTTYTTGTTVHGFSVGDTVTITEVVSTGTSSTIFNTSKAITATTASTFTVALTTTGSTYASGGVVKGWALMTTGNRYVADTGSGSPGWVAMSIAQRRNEANTGWSTFS